MNLRRFILESAVVFVACSSADIFAASPAGKYLKKPNEWFASREALDIAANILSYQADLGGWPKNVDTTAAPYTGERKDLKPTFDNDATTDELRFLARVFNATKDEKNAKAAVKGIDYILGAQYPCGGWPQLRHHQNRTIAILPSTTTPWSASWSCYVRRTPPMASLFSMPAGSSRPKTHLIAASSASSSVRSR